MQLFTAGVLGLVGVVLIVTGINGAWDKLYGAATGGAFGMIKPIDTGGGVDNIVGSVVGSSPVAGTVKNRAGTLGGSLGGIMGPVG